MKIKVTPQLRVLAVFLSTVIRDVNTYSPNNFNSDDLEAVFKIPAAKEWFKNIDENNFDTSYQELEFEEVLWFVFMLLQISKSDFFDLDNGLVVYRYSNSGSDIVIISDKELDERSEEMFGTGERFAFQEDEQATKVVEAFDAESFDFAKYVNELIEEARK